MRSREVRWKMEEGRWKREDGRGKMKSGIWSLFRCLVAFPRTRPCYLVIESVVLVATARGRIGGATALVLVLIAALTAILIASLTSSLSIGRGLG